MPGAARKMDIWAGICCCHPPIPCIPMSGPIITYSPDTFANNRNVARFTDVVIGWCGHPGVIVTGSPNVITNNLQTARCGDSVVGCTIGSIVTCSPDVIVNG